MASATSALEPADRAAARWLFLTFTALYLLTMGGRTYSVDDIARYDTVVAIVEHHGLEIPPSPEASHATNEGRVYSKYGLGKPLLLIPFYLTGRALERARLAPDFLNAPVVASTLDQFLAAAVVALLYITGRLLGYRCATAAALAAVAGACTMLWPLSKFAFEHPLVALLALGAFAALLRLRRGGGAGSAALAGACLGYVLLTRVADFAFSGLPLGVYFLLGLRRAAHPRRFLLAFGLPILVAGAVLLAYNQARFGDFMESGYEDNRLQLRSLYVGLAGLLVSTGKSLFLWNPPLIAALAAFGAHRARHRAEALLGLGLALTYLAGYGSYKYWHGDWCVGPRYLLPMVPFLLLAAGDGLEDSSRRQRVALLLGATAVAGAFVAVVGMAVDYSLYCGRFEGDLDRARFVPYQSPLVVNWGHIRRGEVTLFWREVVRAETAPAWLKAFALVPAAGVLAGALGLARAVRTGAPGHAATTTTATAAMRTLRPRPWMAAAAAAALAALLGLAVILALVLGGARRGRQAPAGHGLTGRFFAGPEWAGEPVLTRIDARLDFVWSRDERPVPGAFSAEWTGSLVVPASGYYKFFLRSDDGSWLYLDDRLVVDNGGAHAVRQIAESTYLAAGLHPLRLLYFDSGFGDAALELGWTAPHRLRKRTIAGRDLLPRPYRGAAEHALDRALSLHAAGRLDEAARAYEALLSPTEIGVAARAQRVRAQEGRPPLVPGLEADPPGVPMGLPFECAFTPDDETPAVAHDPAAPGTLSGALVVSAGEIVRLGITANVAMTLSSSEVSLASGEGGFDERLISLGPGLHPLTVTVLPRPGVLQAEIWWQRPGEEREPVPRAFLLRDALPPGGVPPGPEELAYLDLLAAREYEELGRHGRAAACYRRLLAAGDSAVAVAALRRLALGGVQGTYYATEDWSGRPLLTRIDDDLDFDWSLRRLVPGPISAIWEGQLQIDSTAVYGFELESDDGAWLHVGDRRVVDNGGVHAPRTASGQVMLAAGLHKLRVNYFDTGYGKAVLRLFWRPPGAEGRELVPRERLLRPAESLAAVDSGAGPDPALADFSFDSGAYLDWIATGEAFGRRPALGAIGVQQSIVNPAGGALANSYWRGNDFYQGELRSRPFVVEGSRLRFWIGGGHDEERLYLGLEIDGRIVRRATGADSEVLRPEEWDVAELAGQLARLVIVDRASSHWGHILVDEIAAGGNAIRPDERAIGRR